MTLNQQPIYLNSVGALIPGPGVLVSLFAVSTGTAGNIMIRDGVSGPIICQLRVAATDTLEYPNHPDILIPFTNSLYVEALATNAILLVFCKINK